MKFLKVLLVGISIVISLNVKAQFSAGGGIVIASHSGYNLEDRTERFNGGIQLLSDYMYSDKINIGANINFFYPQKFEDESTEVKATGFLYNANLDVKFKFYENIHNAAYVIIGPSFGGIRISADRISESASFFGGHLGFGVDLPNNVFYDIRLQYRQWETGIDLSNYQAMLTVGYRFQFNSNAEEEVLETDMSNN